MDDNKQEAEVMGIEVILRFIEQMLADAPRIPLTGKIMLDGDAFFEQIDKIYAILPEEIKQAQQVLDQSDKLLESVELQGKRIIEEARNQAASLLKEEPIYQEAQAVAAGIISQAEREAQELREGALNYASDVFHQVELNLEKAVLSVRHSREELKNV
ncbi:MAG: hypothetical protein LBB91_03910 [Clostridiales bacterium]|jgi:cell division septum initiation protein DivIVA|nr:hypothetical protein [Clostridiales bacterium]